MSQIEAQIGERPISFCRENTQCSAMPFFVYSLFWRIGVGSEICCNADRCFFYDK